MVEVIPIACTGVDWKLFLSAASKLLGRSVTRGCDAKRLPVGDVASYLMALGEFQHEGSDPHATLRQPGALLRHAHFAFLVVASRDAIQEIAILSGLGTLMVEGSADHECAIISGNLEEWRTAVINGCAGRSAKHARLFFDKCLLHFERAGLGQVWTEYTKRGLTDSSFLLELK